jgi:hypothetical protein
MSTNNKTQSNRSSTGSSNRIAFNQWKQMSKEAQGIWETIPDSEKAIILKASKPSSQMRSSPSGNCSTPQRSVYVCEMEHVEDDADPFDALVDAAAEDDSGGTTLLAHVTKQKSFAKPSGSNIPPSDIRKVLSTNKGNDGSKPNPSEFNVNGKIYRLENKARIVYWFTAPPNQGASLIDCGANGVLPVMMFVSFPRHYSMLILKVLLSIN